MKNLKKFLIILFIAGILAFIMAESASSQQALGAGSGTIDKLPQYIEIKEAGVSKTTKAKSLNFTGATVTGTNGAMTIAISAGGGAWGTITGTLSNQTDLQAALDAKQPLDSDLTTIAGLTATTDNFLQSKAGAWASRTIAQVKTDLGLSGTNSGDQTTAGTTNRITVTNGSTSPVVDIAATYVGQSSLTTLGTITTGVWNGTAIANANLANSTISGISLGSNLNALTATDTSLTFSGSYNGNLARTVGLNLANANTWTGKQTFNTTAPRFGTITGSTQCLHVDTNGDISGTGSDCGSGSGGLTVGTTAIASGTTTRVLYDNAGTLGEYTVSGSGNVAMTTNGVFTTPNLGVPSAITLTNATGLPIAGLVSSTSTALGVGSLELGNASDTTLTRSAGGILAVEGIDQVNLSASQTLTNKTLTTPVINGTITGTGQATAATASTIVMRDANANTAVNNITTGFATTATAAGTTTMTVADKQTQVWTGSSTQTIKLPTTSVLQGQQYTIINQSSGAVTVQSSGANTIVILAASTSASFTAVVAAPTTAANWDAQYLSVKAASGKSGTFSNTLTLAGTDNSTLNIGTGGTLGTAAYTATGAYEVPLTFSTGLTRSTNTITVNTSQNIATLSNLTSNGLVTTSASNGTLGITAMGTGIATFLGTPTSANLAAAITNETGSGALVFGTSPDFTTSLTLGGVAVDTISSTATLTNKTMTSSTNVLGGVTMTLGSDASYDTYYRSSGGVLTRLANGTTGQVLTATTGGAPTWTTLSIPTVPYYSQQIVTNNGSNQPNSSQNFSTSNNDGSILIIYDSGQTSLTRWARDSATGRYNITHSIDPTISCPSSDTCSMVVLGSFIYYFSNGGTNVTAARFALADLTGETNMTVPTVGCNGAITAWTNNTSIYFGCGGGAGGFTTTAVNWTVSGTTFSAGTNGTLFDNLFYQYQSSTFNDGTNIYVVQTQTGAATNWIIHKCSDAFCSSKTTTTTLRKSYSSLEGQSPLAVNIDATKYYVGWLIPIFNATVQTNAFWYLEPVTKP